MKIKRPKGALPIPYIVALIIAIIVIAVLIYWSFARIPIVVEFQSFFLFNKGLEIGDVISFCEFFCECSAVHIFRIKQNNPAI